MDRRNGPQEWTAGCEVAHETAMDATQGSGAWRQIKKYLTICQGYLGLLGTMRSTRVLYYILAQIQCATQDAIQLWWVRR
jgi:hypothetical protein